MARKNTTKKMSQESSRKVKENTKCNLLAESVSAIGSTQSPENSYPIHTCPPARQTDRFVPAVASPHLTVKTPIYRRS